MPNKKLPKKKDAGEIKTQNDLQPIEGNILPVLGDDKNAKYYSAIFSAALGSIPWVGGVYSTLLTIQSESAQKEINDLQKIWLHEHQEKILNLGKTLKDIINRLDEISKAGEVEELILERIQSIEYLNLVKQTFQSWDKASTVEKQVMFKKLITNAATIELCSDDLVRVFIKWIEDYHEFHFQIVSEIYKNSSMTRGAIWDNLFGKGPRPREDSAQADLYKYLIRELSQGGVIRQEKEKNARGEFVKKRYQKRSPNVTMKSAFDEEEKYELTELGSQFIHYVMKDVVPQIQDGEEHK